MSSTQQRMETATQSQIETVVREATPTPRTEEATLILQAERPAEERRVQWDENVVDNEKMNKKKSKVCCIFHPNRQFGESSSSGSDSSDGDLPNAYEREPHSRRKARKKKHKHEHDPSCPHNHDHPSPDGGSGPSDSGPSQAGPSTGT